jgi:hypothetical protein
MIQLEKLHVEEFRGIRSMDLDFRSEMAGRHSAHARRTSPGCTVCTSVPLVEGCA